MKEEKKGVTFFVILAMFFLIMIIALPPVLRFMIKEEEPIPSIEEEQLKTMKALICRKQVSVGTMIYNITATSNYQGETLNKVSFLYTRTTPLDSTVLADPVIEEMNTFRGVGLFTETQAVDSVKFEIQKDTMDQNQNHPVIFSVAQPYELQKSNLESNGYTCQTMTG